MLAPLIFPQESANRRSRLTVCGLCLFITEAAL
jgi:hypothetical protein